jgi:hypothetical protein
LAGGREPHRLVRGGTSLRITSVAVVAAAGYSDSGLTSPSNVPVDGSTRTSMRVDSGQSTVTTASRSTVGCRRPPDVGSSADPANRRVQFRPSNWDTRGKQLLPVYADGSNQLQAEWADNQHRYQRRQRRAPTKTLPLLNGTRARPAARSQQIPSLRRTLNASPPAIQSQRPPTRAETVGVLRPAAADRLIPDGPFGSYSADRLAR